MRFGLTALTLAACAAWAVPASAQEPGAKSQPTHESDLGRHLLIASEAKLAEGKALLASGRVDEGLRALREIAALLQRHERIVRARTPGVRVAAGPKVPSPKVPTLKAPAAIGRPAIAVEAALDWLARHQGDDGAWRSKSFSLKCAGTGCGGSAATDDHTIGVTSLAVLAFLGSGHTHRSPQYAAVVRNGLRYLQSQQAENGRVGGQDDAGHFMYGHCMATLAFAEVFGMTQTPSFKVSAQHASEWLLAAQNPYLGWRYGVRPGDNDSSVTAWAVLALKSCRVAGLKVPDHAFAGARNWFDKMTEDGFGRTGYTQRGDHGARMADAQQYQPTGAMTAAAIACRRLMGQSAEDPIIKTGAAYFLRDLPEWEPKRGNDYYYWYFGTLASWQVGGRQWQKWSPKLRDVLVKNQRSIGEAKGSWDTQSAWGKAGGRVYTTAINCLSLQIYNRSTRGK